MKAPAVASLYMKKRAYKMLVEAYALSGTKKCALINSWRLSLFFFSSGCRVAGKKTRDRQHVLGKTWLNKVHAHFKAS